MADLLDVADKQLLEQLKRLAAVRSPAKTAVASRLIVAVQPSIDRNQKRTIN